jgi:hypothetical protein
MTLLTAQDDRDKDADNMHHIKPISSSIGLPQDHYTTRSQLPAPARMPTAWRLQALQEQGMLTTCTPTCHV